MIQKNLNRLLILIVICSLNSLLFADPSADQERRGSFVEASVLLDDDQSSEDEPYFDAGFLHRFVINRNNDLLKHYLDLGADPNQRDTIGMTPLHKAAMNENIIALSMLILADAEVNAIDFLGRSPLYWAVMNENTRAISMLVASGADIFLEDRHGNSPFSIANYHCKIAMGIRPSCCDFLAYLFCCD